MRFIQNWWWKRQRAIDMKILWPAMKEHAKSIHAARRVFMMHAVSCPCWTRHYKEGLWTHITGME